MQRLFCLLSAVSLTLAALSGTATTTAANNNAAQLTLKGGLADTILLSVFAVASGGLSFDVTVSTSVPTTVTLGIALDLNNDLFGSVNIAGGASNAPFLNLNGVFGLGGNALALTLTTSPPASVNLTLTTPTLTTNLGANVQPQAHLLAGAPGLNANANANAQVYGAVGFTINGKTVTYSIPAPVNANINSGVATQQLYLVSLDIKQALAAAITGITQKANSTVNAGSAAFDYTKKFVPVALGSAFNLVVGQQYSFGNNILVTPIAQGNAGVNSDAGSLSISYVGQFNAGGSASSAPNSAGYLNGYYQISGSANANNVLQWSADTATNGAVFVNSAGTAVNATAFAAAKNTISWYKSTTAAGVAAAANTWQKVDSYTGVTASGRLSVYANVNTYSQWTVAASGSSAATTKVAALFVAVVAFLACML